MKTIKFMLEYDCSPIWVENEDGELIGNGLPSELATNYELAGLLEEIHETFDNLYENNDVYFGYHGFSNELKKRAFFTKVTKAVDLLKLKAENTYIIQVDVDEANF